MSNDTGQQPSTGTPVDPRGAPLLGLQRALCRYFSRRGVAPADADDLVQDVFLRIVKRGNEQAIDNLDRYAFTVAASVLADRGRRRTARLVDAHVSFEPQVHGADEIDPERTLSGQQLLRATTRALMELPERTRQVFVLRRLEGMPYSEITVRLGISLSAAEKHMLQATRHLTARAGATS